MLISLDADAYTKTLGIACNTTFDHFRLTVARLPPTDNLNKLALVSDIARTFDVLGWFSPSIVKAEILLQFCWEQKLDWDDTVPRPYMMIGTNGDLNFTYSLRKLSHNVTLKKHLKSPPLSFMFSPMHQRTLMLL